MPIPNRKRFVRIACVIVILVIAAFVGWVGFAFLSADLVVASSVKESRIGEPADRVDAFVPDGHRDQHYFVAFTSLHLLKGAYATNTLGIRLHSPALTFGIRDDQPEGRGYLLFFRYVATADGQKILLLKQNLKTYL